MIENCPYFTDDIVNNTNVLELWYLTDVDVSSYTGHYDMQIAYLFGFVFVQANASTGPLLIVASRLLRRLLSRLLSLILSRLFGRLYYCV